jgi:hypothetical protein
MKYYETSFIDYIKSVDNFNIHKEKEYIYDNIPENFDELTNLIFTGPSGVGKYSQAIKIIQKYSETSLKYDKKITCFYDKQNYTYRHSDIHYEIDISLLGCNSKQLWHDIFFQIIDIITIKPKKQAILLCKNFHTINSELLEIFYSYIQHNKINPNINIKFFLITEHISFIPYNIINSSIILNYKKPNIDTYKSIHNQEKQKENGNDDFISRLLDCKLYKETSKYINDIDESDIINIKDFRYFDLIKNNDIPNDLFNTVCDNIIHSIINFKSVTLLNMRENLYDILTYNIDIYECIWYVLYYLIDNDYIDDEKSKNILKQLFLQLKYYNNNYRPIYHLERIIYTIIIEIHNIK